MLRAVWRAKSCRSLMEFQSRHRIQHCVLWKFVCSGCPSRSAWCTRPRGRATHAWRCVTLNAGAGPLRSLPALSSVRAHPAGCMPPQLLPSWGHDVAVARWGRWPRRTCIAGGVKALRNFECRSWASPTLTASAQQCARPSSGLHAAAVAALLEQSGLLWRHGDAGRGEHA